jgi:hypothetical protein
MQSFVVNFKRAAFGWPLYAAHNLAAYTIECRGRATAATLLMSVLFWCLTTGAWVALWMAVFWLLLRPMGWD